MVVVLRNKLPQLTEILRSKREMKEPVIVIQTTLFTCD